MSCFVQIILNPFSQTELSMSLFLFLVKYNWMQLKAVFSVFKSYTYCFSYVPLCSTLLQNMAAQNSKFLSHSWADGLCFVEIFHIIFLVVVSRRGVGWHHERFNWDAHLRDDFFPHEWVLTGVGWGRAGTVGHWPGKPLTMHIYEIRRHGSINFRISFFVYLNFNPPSFVY